MPKGAEKGGELVIPAQGSPQRLNTTEGHIWRGDAAARPGPHPGWRQRAAPRPAGASVCPTEVTYVDDDGEFPDASQNVVPDSWGRGEAQC